jgi:lipopolysaccharide/colanic/teichoic acid biosynthesis glycosyltransferase
MRDEPAQDGPSRLTPVGRFPRNYSLDHLPMLVNVVRGDMSLIGPRPTEPERVDLNDADWQRVLSVRPGMISYAVLRLARTYNDSSPQQRLRLEATYVERAGLGFDVRLLARAVGAVFRSRGNV